MAGSVGVTGPSGPAGAQGPSGWGGAQGSAGIVDRWTSYRYFTFDHEQADIHASDMRQVSDIASYLAQNPSLRLGIDGSTDPRVTDWNVRNLAERRVDAVRNALILAGVPAYQIETGAFGDPQLRRDRQVETLLITAR